MAPMRAIEQQLTKSKPTRAAPAGPDQAAARASANSSSERDGLVPRDGATRGLARPIEIRVDDDAFRHERGAVALVETLVIGRFHLVAEDRGIPFQVAEMTAGIGIEQELVRIEAVPRLGLVRAVDAVAVERAGVNFAQIAVPDLVRVFQQLHALALAPARRVEQAHFDPGGVWREQHETGAL